MSKQPVKQGASIQCKDGWGTTGSTVECTQTSTHERPYRVAKHDGEDDGQCHCAACAEHRAARLVYVAPGKRTGPACYVCGQQEHLEACRHCGSPVCRTHARDGFCTLCAATRKQAVDVRMAELKKKRHEFCEGVAAAAEIIEAKALIAQGLMRDVLRAVAAEVRREATR